ncbi:MAG: hypothetical protein BWX55_00745 [Deltaproteobacteria bacterium ADurb.Bin022]|nr:MAG: hypothetical protein BWX55_00745 [Deltaproteobacteria bacterium ADurb.Bin022]
MLTSETDQVGIAPGNGLIGHCRIIDPTHADDRNAHHLFKRTGPEQIESGFGIH